MFESFFNALALWFAKLQAQFKLCFIDDNRFERYIVDGFAVTLQITFFALLIGVTLGVLVALIRVTYDKNAQSMRKGAGRRLLGVLNWFAKLFLTVIRGVPVVVQLLIWFFVILAASRNGVFVAIIAFGINSAAYTAEIMRGGIMSVDAGQNEAGRSLGFSYIQTMRYIILPQAFKNALPTLCNEFIVLLKETAVAGYVAVTDLTKGAYIIQGRTFVAFMPLFAAALIYLAMVMLLSWLFGKLERRLRASDKR